MSTLRHRFRLVVDGTKYEIVTSARDLAAAEIGPGATAGDLATGTFRLIHAACLRLELPGIPSEWEAFADVLDEVEDLEPDTEAEVNPTHATVSATPPSR